MNDEDVYRRIASFLLGAVFAPLCGLIACIGWVLLTMKMNPDLAGPDYWREVSDRAANNLPIVAVIAAAGVGVVSGVVLMVRAVVYRSPSPGGPP